MFKSIRSRLIAGSLVAIAVPLLALSTLLSAMLWNFYLGQLSSDLRTKALVIADSAERVLSPETPDNPPALRELVDHWRHFSNVRITIASAKGIIEAATAAEDDNTPVSETDRPGMPEAIAGHENSTIWRNPSFGYQDTMYVNVPVMENRRPIGAIRVSYTLTQVLQSVQSIREALYLSVLVYAILLIVAVVWLSGTITRPVEELTAAARVLGRGDLDHPVPVHVSGTRETTQLSSTLEHMRQRLHQLEQLRRQYVSDVSHELRTPLAAIRGMAETLQEHAERDPEIQQRYLPRIIAHTDRLARLVNQLLDLARIESGSLVSQLAPVSLRAVEDEVAGATTPLARNKGVQLNFNVSPLSLQVNGDRDRLIQALLNLVDNAIRYTPAGGTVTVNARQEGADVVVDVTDTGSGIAAEHLPYLFDRFYRVDSSRARGSGGSGLGLSIVQRIVEAHGGAVTVSSVVGQGTTFTIRVPLSAPETAAGAGASSPSTAGAGTAVPPTAPITSGPARSIPPSSKNSEQPDATSGAPQELPSRFV